MPRFSSISLGDEGEDASTRARDPTRRIATVGELDLDDAAEPEASPSTKRCRKRAAPPDAEATGGSLTVVDDAAVTGALAALGKVIGCGDSSSSAIVVTLAGVGGGAAAGAEATDCVGLPAEGVGEVRSLFPIPSCSRRPESTCAQSFAPTCASVAQCSYVRSGVAK